MKKGSSMCIVFCLLLSLAACSAGGGAPASSGPTEDADSAASAGSAPVSEITSGGALSGSFVLTEEISEPVVGNMQKNVPSGDFVAADGKFLFTAADPATGEPQLFTYDPDTKAVNPFCRDATCNHRTAACAAGGVDCNLESHGGEVYGRSNTAAGEIMRLKDGRFESTQIEGGVSHFFHYGQYLFVATLDSSLIVFEGNSKTPKTLLDEYTGYWETVCDGVLYYHSNGVCRLDLTQENAEPELLVKDADHITDGEYIYYTGTDDLLYRCGMDGSAPEQLTDRPVLVASWNFDDDYFYFRYHTGDDMLAGDSQDLYRFPKDAPAEIEKFCTLPAPAYQIFTDADSDFLFVKTLGNDEQVGEDIYIVSKETNAAELLDF